MGLAIQVVSPHPLLTRAVEKALAHRKGIRVKILPSLSNETAVLAGPTFARLFLVDACSLQGNLAHVPARWRAHAPGSKFLALHSADAIADWEKTHLFFCGIDGFVEMHERWASELTTAILSILQGKVWVPPSVLLEYVKQVKLVLDAQMLPGHSLTAREGQVLQLLMRQFANKEISHALNISERTVKFHVSNILGKLGVKDRRELSPRRKPALAYVTTA